MRSNQLKQRYRPKLMSDNKTTILQIFHRTPINGIAKAQADHKTNDLFTFSALNALSKYILACIFILSNNIAAADSKDQAKRLHDRLAGVPASESVLQSMEALIDAGSSEDAAYMAMENPNFYNVTLKNWITPWTNETGDIFAPLNDYTATAIGLIRDSTRTGNTVDFRTLLYGNVLYIGADGLGLPAYNTNNNNHYETMEVDGIDLKAELTAVLQSDYNGLPADATAGIMTSRAGAKAYFSGGTNRAMFKFTLLNHLCKEMEQVMDTTRNTGRIRQDVARSPGGDSRTFNNNCVGCHSGMDPMAQAFAYYEWVPVLDDDGEETAAGILDYNSAGVIETETGSRVQAKYHINENNFPTGYITPDDRWDNFWREGPNSLIGWADSIPGVATPGSGNGAKSLGMELSHSDEFVKCQIEKTFKTVCFRDPNTGNSHDRNLVTSIFKNFESTSLNMKQVFAETAVYCMGD